jgi:bifunctional non-homologous end joining protein LigD
MALEEYNKKRRFDATPEPEGQLSDTGTGRFVVQRHQARRLHYDLRLEMAGVLKSWAVPKGPSMNPDDKRLAVETEDHPVKYLTFQGTIPKGNYGAGEMHIWDEGHYKLADNASHSTPEAQWEKGDLKLEFFGKKLRGRFALVRTRRQGDVHQWLLIKKKDAYAAEGEYDAENLLPEGSTAQAEAKIVALDPNQVIKPMLASISPKIFDDPDWIYELKWDGYRLIAHVTDGNVQLYSRNGVNYNQKFPELVNELKGCQHETIIDGEVVVLNADGLPEFQKLQNYHAGTPGLLRFYVFDMLHLNGHDMISLPLLDRKSLIADVIEGMEHVHYCDHVEAMGAVFYHQAVKAGMEGVVAKKADSRYVPGVRSEYWLKVKAVQSQEALICGFTASQGAPFGSLILGEYHGEQLQYIGNCGSGFSNEDQKNLFGQFEPLITETRPFDRTINLKGRKATWMKPELICEVKYSEKTKSGALRHPVFKALRFDKTTHEIGRPQPKTGTSSSSTNSTLDVDGISVPISNLDKIYWPDSGLRKYDLIDYYLQVSEYILPHLKDRPQNLHRHPNGIQQEGFYQKDNEHLPDWIDTHTVYSKSSARHIEYMLCQNEASLLYMANLGCIELNPWNSTIHHPDHPDYTIIDLDPSEKNTFEQVIEVAQAVHEVLQKAQVQGYCKTSGASGLHVYIPLGAQYSYEEARNFTHILCLYVHEKLPKITTLERSLRLRKDRIYLDYLQNRRGQTLASAYCLRPKPGAQASAPLEWHEVRQGLLPGDFNIHNMPARLGEKGDLFLPVINESIDMAAAIAHLEEED